MVQAKSSNSSQRIAMAARLVIEGDSIDLRAGRFSRTIFMANKAGDAFVERCAFKAALENGVSAVSMRFGRDMTATSRRANVAFVHEGKPIEARDCVIWAANDDERVVLVPSDVRYEYHFVVGLNGLELRPGRPATMLGEGIARAKARLERAARRLKENDCGLSTVIVTDVDAA